MEFDRMAVFMTHCYHHHPLRLGAIQFREQSSPLEMQ